CRRGPGPGARSSAPAFPGSAMVRAGRHRTIPIAFVDADLDLPPGKRRRWAHGSATSPGACARCETARRLGWWAAAGAGDVPAVLRIPAASATAWSTPPRPANPDADKADRQIGAG